MFGANYKKGLPEVEQIRENAEVAALNRQELPSLLP